VNGLFSLVERIAGPVLRISLGLIILWIGALKFADPSPVVGLLHASLPFLAFKGFVYTVGALEIAASILLLTGIAVRYVGLLILIIFAGTLTIFVIAPSVTYGPQGFPYLSLAGQFLLKDLVLASAAIAMVAMESMRVRAHRELVPRHVAA
jgi:reactive chlorine resistance protein C